MGQTTRSDVMHPRLVRVTTKLHSLQQDQCSRSSGESNLPKTAILHHHHAPAELAKAKEDKRLIAEAYTRVSTHEAEEKAEKAKAAAMKKLRKIEEEEDDVEPSDVARGKGKMRRIK